MSFRILTASASGFTPLSIMLTQVASVSLSSCVFKISHILTIHCLLRGSITLWYRHEDPSISHAIAMTSAKAKKEKIFHPQSRKAGQLVRASLRKDKLRSLVSKRGLKHHSLVDGYRFYHQCVPDEGVLALEELHSIVRDTWLTRFGVELEAEQATRRKGRPKSTSQIKLEELKLRESEEYRTGLEVVDLTHGPTVELFKKWDQKEIAYVEQLRFIRISGADPSVAVVSRPGKHPSLLVETDVQMRDIS